jgi:PHD/YefM family antitoxin component YafN of YafNO toxin-antitoxin module
LRDKIGHGSVYIPRYCISIQLARAFVKSRTIKDRSRPFYQDIALTKPVTITKNGRERTVLLSAQEYARLKRRDRRVVSAGELSERQVDAIRNARVPDRYTDLDKELKD